MEKMFNLVTGCCFNQKMKKISNFAVESYLKSIKYCLSFSVLHSFTVQHSNPFSLRGKLQSPLRLLMLHVQIFFYMKQQNVHVRKQSCLKKLTVRGLRLFIIFQGLLDFRCKLETSITDVHFSRGQPSSAGQHLMAILVKVQFS